MDEQLLAYLAGCLDSDGYFTIRRDTRGMKLRERTPTHNAMVGLRQVTAVVPDLLYETFGGSRSVTKPSADRGRPLASWHVMSAAAARACVLLLPYLRIKPAQAQLLIDLQARKGARRGVGGVARNTDEEIAARDELRHRVKSLNATGV